MNIDVNSPAENGGAAVPQERQPIEQVYAVTHRNGRVEEIVATGSKIENGAIVIVHPDRAVILPLAALSRIDVYPAG